MTKKGCQNAQNKFFGIEKLSAAILISLQVGYELLASVNSNTTGTITPMFSSYDWMKPNLKQKAGTARGKWLVRKDWAKLGGVKSLFLSENMLEKSQVTRNAYSSNIAFSGTASIT